MPNQWTSPTKPHERTPLPEGKQWFYVVLPDGMHANVALDWRMVYVMARRAAGHVASEAEAGPVRVKVPQLQPELAARLRARHSRQAVSDG